MSTPPSERRTSGRATLREENKSRTTLREENKWGYSRANGSLLCRLTGFLVGAGVGFLVEGRADRAEVGSFLVGAEVGRIKRMQDSVSGQLYKMNN